MSKNNSEITFVARTIPAGLVGKSSQIALWLYWSMELLVEGDEGS